MSNTITGTNFSINVGKNYKGKLNIFGETKQEARSGKNLLHIALNKGYTLTDNGITFTVNNDYSVTINGTATGITFLELNYKDDYYLEVIKGKKYTQSLSNGNNYISLVTQFNEEDNTTFLFPTSEISLQTQTAQYSGKTKSYIRVALGATINNLTVYPMLVEGEFTEETIGDYEPYGASPSPDYPSEIENIEGKNKLDLSKCSFNHCVLNSDGKSIICNIVDYYWAQINTSQFNTYLLKNKGKTLTFSTGTALSANTSVVIYGTRSDGSTYQEQNEGLSGKCTFTVDNDFTQITSVEFRINRKNPRFTDTSTIINYAMLEEGTVATEYVPYNSLEFGFVGKNIIPFPYYNKTITTVGVTFTQNDDGSITVNGTATANGMYAILARNINSISPKEGKYTFSGITDGSTSTHYLQLYINGKSQESVTTKPVIHSINKGDVINQISFFFKEGAVFDNLIIKPQLEYGSEATDYEPYKSQTETFPLAEGQKLYEASYLADDGIHHTRKQYVITGEENWVLGTQYAPEYGTRFDCNITKYPTAGINDVVCTHYKFVGINAGGCWVSHNSKYLQLRIQDNISTVDELKTYLQEQYSNGTPVIVEYELAEEEIIPYTEEQREAWEELQNIYLFDGTNNIFSIGSKIEPKLELTYLKIVEDDIDCYISENGRFVILEYGINYLIDFNASNIPSMPEATEATVRIVGKDGDVVLNTTYEPIPFSIVCYTDDNLTLEEKVVEEQKINRFMDSIKNETKTFAIEKDSKYYDVKYSGILTTIRFPAHVQFTIPFKSSEAYAMDLIKKNITGNNSVNSDTIKDVGAIFTIKGPAQTPKISFNNYEMFYDNVLLENTKLIIDSNKSTITHVNNVTGSKTNAMRYYNHQFPKVKYGENTLVVNSGIDDDSQVTVEWNDLKL